MSDKNKLANWRASVSYTCNVIPAQTLSSTQQLHSLQESGLQPNGRIVLRPGQRGTIFSFFSGAGFLDLGFEHEGFFPVLVNEFHPPFLAAYQHSRRILGMDVPDLGYLAGSIETVRRGPGRQWLRSKIAEARKTGLPVGFVGGPPCPDFSNAGKHGGKEGYHGRLTRVYVDTIRDMKPDFFVFENVKGLMTTHSGHLKEIENLLGKAGYRISTRLVNSLEYGVPQDRERVVIIGVHRTLMEAAGHPVSWFYRLPDNIWLDAQKHDVKLVKELPWPTMEPFVANSERPRPPGILSELTVQHWFSKNDVARHPNALQRMQPKQGLPRMMSIFEGDTKKKSFKRLHRWRYSATAAYGHLEVHLHPTEARRLSVAEALAIQSMPKDFQLPQDMTLTDAFKTVGNGVPYLMARGLARVICQQLNTYTSSPNAPTLPESRQVSQAAD